MPRNRVPPHDTGGNVSHTSLKGYCRVQIVCIYTIPCPLGFMYGKCKLHPYFYSPALLSSLNYSLFLHSPYFPPPTRPSHVLAIAAPSSTYPPRGRYRYITDCDIYTLYLRDRTPCNMSPEPKQSWSSFKFNA